MRNLKCSQWPSYFCGIRPIHVVPIQIYVESEDSTIKLTGREVSIWKQKWLPFKNKGHIDYIFCEHIPGTYTRDNDNNNDAWCTIHDCIGSLPLRPSQPKILYLVFHCLVIFPLGIPPKTWALPFCQFISIGF